MLSVGFIVYPSFQALGLRICAVFEQANIIAGQATYQCTLTSAEGGLIRSSLGFDFETERLGEHIFDTVIVAGDNKRAPSTPELAAYLIGPAKEARRIASICTAAFKLANLGLLDGRRATTHWRYARELAISYPRVQVEADRIFVVDGPIWTSAGMSAGFDLALAMVEKDHSPGLAREVARKLVLYQRRGGGQSQFSTLLELDARSDRVQKVLAYARENLAADLTVDALAQIACLSPRQFSRVFTEETGQSPAKAVERLRVEAARIALETSRRPIEEIAQEVGFGDRERMRHAFIRAFGVPPQSIKRVSHVMV